MVKRTKKKTPANRIGIFDAYGARRVLVADASARLSARITSAMSAIHEDDRVLALMSAEQNAYDTMVEAGCPKISARSFKYRKSVLSTLADIADCAEDYGYRRAAEIGAAS